MKMVILILVGIVLFTTSLALLMYTKQNELAKQNTNVNMVEVYLSAKDLKEGELLEADAIKKAKLPREYVVGGALTASEIIGRYAKVDILENEPIRSEKITLKKPEIEEETQLQTPVAVPQSTSDEVHDTISLPLSVFKNIDTTLKKGDTIDIVSVESKQKGRETDFDTKYIALNVMIDNFVENGKMTNTYIASYLEGKPVFAQSIVLKISPKEIKNFLMLYYRTLALNENRVYNTNNNGGHLWIVKCSKQQDEDMQKKKEKMLADYVTHVKQSVKKVSKPSDEASISYEE